MIASDSCSHADDAQGILYLSLANRWMDGIRALAAEEDDKDADEVVQNPAALRAMGASVWSEGDTGRGLLRIVLK